MPDRPFRRHGDELGLHPPASGIFRIFEAALERIALRWRQLFEDFFLVLLVKALEQFDRVVGLQLAHALRDRLGLEFLEDFLADGVVDFVQRREVEMSAGQLNEADAVVGLERRDQIAEISLMEFRNHGTQERLVGGMNRARDLVDEFAANFAIFCAHRQPVEHGDGGLGNVLIFGHAACSAGLTELRNSSELSLHALPNGQYQAQ